MSKQLLVELGLEELPAYVVTSSMYQLRDKMANFLKDNRLDFEAIEVFSTPRRLAVRVNGLSDKQSDLTEDFKGPSKKIALDVDGNFSKAAQGFVRGKGLTTDDITFREIKGEEYVYVTKYEQGLPVEEVLKQIPSVLIAMNFPVSMHWASNDFAYIRPVHTLTILLDDQPILVDFLDIQSGRVSRGHRFLGHEVEIASADSYEKDLASVFVVVNPEQRQGQIVSQIKALEEKYEISVEIDDDLLNEVLNLVEYPTAFLGSFDAKYLDVPEEVLVTSMKNHQRYFVVRDKSGRLLPNFVSVRNGNEEHIENVIKGNEKVLVARLEDGEFFWKEDQKLAISDLVEKLSNVTFHEKIGSLAEHMQRTKAIARLLADKLALSHDDVEAVLRAADIYKFDLLTGMVGEFDELQGVMGEKYALLAGETPEVAQAIREHYLPNSSEGALPESKIGAVLALADKLDTIVSFFSVGLIPSGSNDPYALRRATQGVVRILEAFHWNIALDQLVSEIFALDCDSLAYTHETEVLAFFKARIAKMMKPSISKDIVEAVLASTTFVVSELLETAEILSEKSKTSTFKSAVESLSRVFNLSEKVTEFGAVNLELFENDSERNLYQAIVDLRLGTDKSESIQALFNMSSVIDAFFENTMVMVDDEAIKINRLTMLATLTAKAATIARFNQINTK